MSTDYDDIYEAGRASMLREVAAHVDGLLDHKDCLGAHADIDDSPDGRLALDKIDRHNAAVAALRELVKKGKG